MSSTEAVATTLSTSRHLQSTAGPEHFGPLVTAGAGDDDVTSAQHSGRSLSSINALSRINAQPGDDRVDSTIVVNTSGESIRVQNLILGGDGTDELSARIDILTDAQVTATIRLDGQAGNDSLTGEIIGQGRTILYGGGGNDILPAIGGNNSLLVGGADEDRTCGSVANEVRTCTSPSIPTDYIPIPYRFHIEKSLSFQTIDVQTYASVARAPIQPEITSYRQRPRRLPAPEPPHAEATPPARRGPLGTRAGSTVTRRVGAPCRSRGSRRSTVGRPRSSRRRRFPDRRGSSACRPSPSR